MQACARAAGHHVRCCSVRWVAVCNPCLAMPCGWNTRTCWGRSVWGDATTADERQSVLAALSRQGRWVTVYYGWRPNLPDEGDNHLFELALAGGAQAIVTHNLRDLRGGELRLGNLRELTPAQCLEDWK